MMDNHPITNGNSHVIGGPLLDMRTHVTLACPDFAVLRTDRRDRTRATMLALNPGLTKIILPEADVTSNEDKAAICIQSHYRGYLARKQYVDLLFEQFNKEEKWRAERTLRQVEEGELLVQNHKLQLEFEENNCVRRNRLQRYTANVITIQRAWRQFKRRKPQTVQRPRHPGHGYRGDRDANGNRTDAERSLRSGARDAAGRPLPPSPRINNWLCLDRAPVTDITNSADMTAARRSKAQQHAMLSDLGSSVELDDNDHHVYESSPEIVTGDKKKNRLSLAEEFAAAMDEDDGMSGEVADCEDSDLNESEADSSSCATTPEWGRRNGPTTIRNPSLDILADDRTLPSDRDDDNVETNSSTMQEPADPNENYRLDAPAEYNADPNANLVSLEPCRDYYHAPAQETNARHPSCDGGDEAGSRLARKAKCQDDDAVRAVSPNRTSTGGTRPPTHPKLQKCASADLAPQGRDSVLDGEPSPGACRSSSGNLDSRRRPGGELECVEPTMPVLDWESLEKHLAKMEKEEGQQSYKQTQKHSRQAILRKLAMGTDDEAEGDIYGKGKDKLSMRLQSGMNLQICFVNEPADGSDLEDDSPRILAAGTSTDDGGNTRSKDNPITNRFGRVSGSRLTGAADVARASRETSYTTITGSSCKVPSVTFEDEDFETRQARLQDEARVALARAEPLARMQMELERQQRKKSPVTELSGVLGMTDISDRLYGKQLTPRSLRNMSISKLQFVVNDLHSQIESLNEELVQLLIKRDELQMEQDSKLIDIEDLSRWIRMNIQQSNNNNNTIISKQPMENGRKRQYETLLHLLGSTLPVSRKCFCGISRSSSVVSSRSASSPEIQEMASASSPLVSPQTASICRSVSSMSINESRASSPEMTWVRQAMIKYWYN